RPNVARARGWHVDDHARCGPARTHDFHGKDDDRRCRGARQTDSENARGKKRSFHLPLPGRREYIARSARDTEKTSQPVRAASAVFVTEFGRTVGTLRHLAFDVRDTIARERVAGKRNAHAVTLDLRVGMRTRANGCQWKWRSTSEFQPSRIR